jgi:hypothetical protein
MVDQERITEITEATAAAKADLLEAENTGLRKQLDLMEQYAHLVKVPQHFTEAWGDLVDPLEHLYDDPTFDGYGGIGGRSMAPIAQVSDRAHGANHPIFRTETELAAIRGAARLIHDVFPTAQTAMDALISYVLGEGFSYKAVDDGESPSGLVSAVQSVIAEFTARNKWFLKEEELFRRSRRDGEVFAALFAVGGGRAEMRFVEPEQVTEPSSSREIEDWIGWGDASDWSFGIHTDADDMETVHGYYCQWSASPGDFDYIPAERMIHAKMNVDNAIKRGLSDFYCVQQYLQNTGKLDRNVAMGAAILSAIIGVREHAQGTTQSQVASLLANSAWRTSSQSTPNGAKSRYVQKIQPGSFLDISKGLTFKQSPLANQGVGEAITVIGQALRRTIGARWGSMPEFIISGDASNNNYASIFVSNSPFVKYCRRQQRRYVAYHMELMWKVLRIACNGGRFSRWGVRTLEGLQSFISLSIQPPIVEAVDRKAETDRRKTLRENDVISTETWTREEGYDADKEGQQIEKEGRRTVPAGGGVVVGGDQAGNVAQQQTAGTASGDGADVATAAAASQQEIQTSTDLVLNGAQIQSALQIALAVAAGTLPKDAGQGQLQILFNLPADKAAMLLGSAGDGTATTPNVVPVSQNPGETPPTPVAESVDVIRQRLEQAAKLIWEGPACPT